MTKENTHLYITILLFHINLPFPLLTQGCSSRYPPSIARVYNQSSLVLMLLRRGEWRTCPYAYWLHASMSTACAMSSSLPGRPAGMPFFSPYESSTGISDLFVSSESFAICHLLLTRVPQTKQKGLLNALVISLGKIPGAMLFTRTFTFVRRHSCARRFERWIAAPFETLYLKWCCVVRVMPDIEVMLITAPR